MRLWWPVGGAGPGLSLVDLDRLQLASVAGCGYFPKHCDLCRDETSLRPVIPLFFRLVEVMCLPNAILRFGGLMEVPN